MGRKVIFKPFLSQFQSCKNGNSYFFFGDPPPISPPRPSQKLSLRPDILTFSAGFAYTRPEAYPVGRRPGTCRRPDRRPSTYGPKAGNIWIFIYFRIWPGPQFFLYAFAYISDIWPGHIFPTFGPGRPRPAPTYIKTCPVSKIIGQKINKNRCPSILGAFGNPLPCLWLSA